MRKSRNETRPPEHPAGLTGLTTEEATRKLAATGANVPSGSVRQSVFRQLLHQLTSPLVLILILAALAAGMLGDRISAVVILTIVIVSGALDFTQTYHSQQAADRLRQQVAPTATVCRDGRWQEISPTLLVPDDLVRVKAGDLIPADAVVVRSESLYVRQAALTGESVAVEKKTSPQTHAAPGADADPNDPGRVYLGTSVSSGSGEIVVVATAGDTAFGKIVENLSVRPPETEFERGMRELSILITRSVFFLVLFVFLVGAIRHHNPFDSLLFAVALAVGMTPEFLPMINTVTLGSGAVRMAHKKVVVKHLPSIENLGSMDILCSDKTGTLTSEAMHLDAALGVDGEQPSPGMMALARLNSRFETGIRNTIDEAILAAPPIAGEPDYTNAVRLGEIPFDFERRCLSVIVTLPDDPTPLVVTKGAPESVLPICTHQIGLKGEHIPLNESARARATDAYTRYSQQGYRVLALATKTLLQRDPAMFSPSDETEMTWAGYLLLTNPPLPEVADTLKKLREDGVTVKIITGDNALVTAHLCTIVDFAVNRIVVGEEIAKMDDTALRSVVEHAEIFARVSPAQKNRIILALKKNGHVVGYIGDGINDAPSLHTADVGISVAGAADVARDAADIILLERSLTVLHEGILEGRRAFANVQKYLRMNLSSNFGNMLSMAGASILLPFLPMLPLQILLNNFLYDLSQITIPTDTVDDEMIRRPRHWEMRVLRNFMLYAGPISSVYDFLTFWVLRSVFHADERYFHTGWFVESLATQTLVIFVVRTAKRPWQSRPSVPLMATMATSLAIAIGLPYTPFAGMLGFVPLPLPFWGFLIVVTATYLALVEWAKRFLIQAGKDRGSAPSTLALVAKNPARRERNSEGI